MRIPAALLAASLLFAPAAEAITLRDLVELHKSGLSDDVLVALIEVNMAIYTLDPETLKRLKADGLSDRVIIAIINSGRANQPPPPVAVVEPQAEPSPSPPVVVIDHHDPGPVVVQQVPVYVPVPVTRPVRRVYHTDPTPASTYYTGQVPERVPRKAPEPQYWGFGGKLRPDAWQPPAPPRKDRDDDRGKGDRGKGKGPDARKGRR